MLFDHHCWESLESCRRSVEQSVFGDIDSTTTVAVWYRSLQPIGKCPERLDVKGVAEGGSVSASLVRNRPELDTRSATIPAFLLPHANAPYHSA